MVICASAILIGCALPHRKLRHSGLWATAILSFATFAFMIEVGVYGLMFVTLPWVGLMALVVQFMDSLGKPRHEKMDC